jgi:hypothetical protein
MTLKNYLSDYLTDQKSANIYICDKLYKSKKPIFLIGSSVNAHINTPFSKDDFLLKLKKFYFHVRKQQVVYSSRQKSLNGRV